MTDTYPKRFDRIDVLRAVAERGDDAEPLTTEGVARATRKLLGVPEWRMDGVNGNADVTGALKSLTAAGDLVTSKAAPRAYSSKNDNPGDAEHRHIVTPGNQAERFYATPAQSKAWRERLEHIAERDDRADRADTLLTAMLDLHADTPEYLRRGHVHRLYARDPYVQVQLTIEQVEKLTDALDHYAGHVLTQMFEPSADEPMPDNAVIRVAAGGGAFPATRTVVYIRNHPSTGLQWRGTDGSYMRDEQVLTFFAEGRATILERGE